MSAPEACPVCGQPRHDRFRPFCSARCADIDLGRWFKGDYVVQGTRLPDDEADNLPQAVPGGATEEDD